MSYTFRQFEQTIDFLSIQRQYLKALEQTQYNQVLQLINLRHLINKSVLTIQRFWKKKQSSYKSKCIIRIQLWWRLMLRRITIQKIILLKFRLTFYKGVFTQKIRNFILSKLKRTSFQPLLNIKHFNTYQCLIPTINAHLVYNNSLSSQIGYMINMKLYNQLKFQKQWQKYEESLKLFINNYIKKRWIKEKGVYLDEKGKQRNKQQFIQKHIEKVYDAKFDKLQQTQKLLVKSITYFKQVEIGLNNKYQASMLQILQKMIYKL